MGWDFSIWVLILTMSGSIHTHEFRSRDGCISAGQAFKDNGGFSNTRNFVCVEKK